MPAKTKNRKPRALSARSNPTLLALLQMGCTIYLPDARCLKGEPDDGYISFSCEGVWLGRYSLDRKGLTNTLADRDFREATTP